MAAFGKFYFSLIIAIFTATVLPKVYQADLGFNDKKYFVSKTQKALDILHYDLSIDLDVKNKIVNGLAILTAVKDQSGNSVLESDLEYELNFYDNMKIISVKINNEDKEYHRKKNRIFIKETKTISDTFTIEIEYSGTPQKGGLDGFVFGSVNGNSLIYNISEPDLASTFFPCDDDPSDKALLDIKITNDSQFVSVSNGNLIEIKNNGAKKTYHYKTVYPISTYLIAVYSAPYKTFTDTYISLNKQDTMQIYYYVLPEHFDKAQIDFAGHSDYLKTLSEIFGEYPFIKEKYGVAEFLWNYGAMENQTITGFGYNFINGSKFYEDTYVHELSHHWWGNSVGPKTWNDIWLNEGFASYTEALYAEAKNGKEALKSKMLAKFSSYFRGTLYAPKDLFGETVYDKGAWVLHILRNEIGDSDFFNILNRYYNTYKYSNASVEDFKNICEEVSHKDLTKFFDQWVYNGTENIFCSVSFDTESNDNSEEVTLYINQKTKDYPEFHFTLDVEILYKNGTSETKSFLINKRNNKFNFITDREVEAILPDPESKLLAEFENEY
ncbi:MAG: M1 family metallopeptidase [Ignavibacteriaceae bacterium]|jgi:aminopeptidase N|nr:M1 family metallopeptidase [Ignavibacteriaceae bacterium]